MNKRLVRAFTTVLFISVFLYFYLSNPDSIKTLFSIGLGFVFLCLIFQLIILIISDLFTKTLVEGSGTKLSFIDGLYSAFLSSYGNYFLPLTGGAFLRGLYLKKHHSFSYKKFISISYGSYLISIGVNSLIGLIMLAYLSKNNEVVPASLVIVLLTLLFATVILSSISFKQNVENKSYTKKISRIVQYAKLISSGWTNLLSKKYLLIKLLLLTILNILVRFLFLYSIFIYLGYDVSIASAFIFNVLISLSTYLTISPGSVGVREALLLLYTQSLGVSVEAILAVNLIERSSMLLLLTALTGIFSTKKNYRISRLFEEKKD
jgi:uncharacterized protein (TIRG00374 family)